VKNEKWRIIVPAVKKEELKLSLSNSTLRFEKEKKQERILAFLFSAI
jgi:hypothetical protein